jgi:hypothetical protein
MIQTKFFLVSFLSSDCLNEYRDYLVSFLSNDSLKQYLRIILYHSFPAIVYKSSRLSHSKWFQKALFYLYLSFFGWPIANKDKSHDTCPCSCNNCLIYSSTWVKIIYRNRNCSLKEIARKSKFSLKIPDVTFRQKTRTVHELDPEVYFSRVADPISGQGPTKKITSEMDSAPLKTSDWQYSGRKHERYIN